MRRAEKFYLGSIIILAAALIIRLVNEARIITHFPLDFANDISSHMARLSFLLEYGYHNLVPNWYHGFNYILFESYSPGWFFLAAPLGKTFGITLGTYISMILLFAIGFVVVYFVLGKLLKLSPVKRILFYLLFFASPTAIGNLIRVGKMPELTGWVTAILLFGLIWHYKDKEIDWKFYWTIPLLAFLILASPTALAVMGIPYIGLFLIKSNKEKLKVLLSAILGFLISSFWFVPFILSSFKKTLASTYFAEWILIPGFTADKIAVIGMSIALVLLSLYYIKEKGKKQLLFLAPFLVLAGLILSRLIVHIPVFNQVYLDSYTLLMLLTSITIFTTVKIKREKWVAMLLIIAVFIATFASLNYTQFYAPENTETEKEIQKLIAEADGVIHFPENDKIYSKAVYSYGAIFHNTYSIRGWYDQGIAAEDLEKIKAIPEESECESFMEYAASIGVTQILAAPEECSTLLFCGYVPTKKEGNSCLFNIEN